MRSPGTIVNSWPQRLAVLGSVLAVLLAFTLVPDGEDRAQQANAAVKCARADLTTSTGIKYEPCVSKVNLKVVVPPNGDDKQVAIQQVQRSPGLSVGDLGNLGDVLPTDLPTLADILGVALPPDLADVTCDVPLIGAVVCNAEVPPELLEQLNAALDDILSTFVDQQGGNLHRVTYADGSSELLYRLTFKGLQFLENVTLQTDTCVDAAHLDAGAGGCGGANPVSLKLKPDTVPGLDEAEAQIGNGSFYTDLWVPADSLLYLDVAGIVEGMNPTPIQDPVLGALASELTGINCDNPMRVDNPLLGVTGVLPLDVDVCGLDLDVRFLVVTTETGKMVGKYPVMLPNTTITLEPMGSAPNLGRTAARGERGTSMRGSAPAGGSSRPSDFIDPLPIFRAALGNVQLPEQQPEEQGTEAEQQPPQLPGTTVEEGTSPGGSTDAPSGGTGGQSSQDGSGDSGDGDTTGSAGGSDSTSGDTSSPSPEESTAPEDEEGDSCGFTLFGGC